MPINSNLNSSEREKNIFPNPNKNSHEVEDIFSHESTEAETPIIEVEQPIEKSVEQEAQPETAETMKMDKSKEDELSQMQPAPVQAQTSPNRVKQKSMELVNIENILSEHLDELFLTMTPQEQMSFKQKGEETAIKINALLQETKIKVKEIINLIKEWLKIIPGVNKFFLEQEAKIKTDRLLNLREQKNKN